MSRTPAIQIFSLILASVALLGLLSWLPPELGAGDFRPYWSASYLLRTGQDFSSPAGIDAVERTLAGWRGPYTMMAWFAPTGNLVLLPYTFLPFPLAARAWLLTNIVLLLTSAYWIWREKKQAWIALAAAFGFSMTLLSLVYGQVNTLEVLGLACFLVLMERGRAFAGGASLVLTTVKPHLVLLTLPLLLLHLVRQRQWRAVAGFGVASLLCGLALFALYPSWPVSLWQLAVSGLSSLREVPTVSGLLVLAGQFAWRQWLWVFALALAVLVWWRKGQDWRLEPLVNVSLLAGLVVAPVGWSYDQVMLLFPVLRLLKWAVDGSLQKGPSLLVVGVLILANLASFIQRLLIPGEVWYFWIPWVVAVVYTFAWHSKKKSRGLETKAAPAPETARGEWIRTGPGE